MLTPAIATTDRSTRTTAGTAGASDTDGWRRLGWSEASVGRTVNAVDGVRVRVRTVDGCTAGLVGQDGVQSGPWPSSRSPPSKYQAVPPSCVAT